MGKLFSLVAMVVAITLSLLPAFGTDQVLAATNYKYNFSGYGADAYWEDCSGSGDVCTYTYISVSEQTSKTKGQKSSSTGMSFYESTYDYINGTYTDRYGFTENAQFKIGEPENKLETVSGSAIVNITLCDNYGCSEDGSVSIDASWVGEGPISTSRGRSMYTSNGFKVMYGDKTKYRAAVAAVSVDGNSLGAPQGSSIYNSSGSYMEVIK